MQRRCRTSECLLPPSVTTPPSHRTDSPRIKRRIFLQESRCRTSTSASRMFHSRVFPTNTSLTTSPTSGRTQTQTTQVVLLKMWNQFQNQVISFCCIYPARLISLFLLYQEDTWIPRLDPGLQKTRRRVGATPLIEGVTRLVPVYFFLIL